MAESPGAAPTRGFASRRTSCDEALSPSIGVESSGTPAPGGGAQERGWGGGGGMGRGVTSADTCTVEDGKATSSSRADADAVPEVEGSVAAPPAAEGRVKVIAGGGDGRGEGRAGEGNGTLAGFSEPVACGSTAAVPLETEQTDAGEQAGGAATPGAVAAPPQPAVHHADVTGGIEGSPLGKVPAGGVSQIQEVPEDLQAAPEAESALEEWPKEGLPGVASTAQGMEELVQGSGTLAGFSEPVACGSTADVPLETEQTDAGEQAGGAATPGAVAAPPQPAVHHADVTGGIEGSPLGKVPAGGVSQIQEVPEDLQAAPEAESALEEWPKEGLPGVASTAQGGGELVPQATPAQGLFGAASPSDAQVVEGGAAAKASCNGQGAPLARVATAGCEATEGGSDACGEAASPGRDRGSTTPTGSVLVSTVNDAVQREGCTAEDRHGAPAISHGENAEHLQGEAGEHAGETTPAGSEAWPEGGAGFSDRGTSKAGEAASVARRPSAASSATEFAPDAEGQADDTAEPMALDTSDTAMPLPALEDVPRGMSEAVAPSSGIEAAEGSDQNAAVAASEQKGDAHRTQLEVLRLIEGSDEGTGLKAADGGVKRNSCEDGSPSKSTVVAGAAVGGAKRIKLASAASTGHAANAPVAPALPTTLSLREVNLLVAETFRQGKPIQALKVFRAMRSTGIAPDRAMFDMFEAALSIPNQGPFLQEFGAEIIDLAGSPLLAAMPNNLPVTVALSAVTTSCFKVASTLFDSLFALDRRNGTSLPPALRTDEVFEGYMRSSLENKVPPMRLEELLTLSLLPSSANSHLWSLAVSVYAMANEPKEAFDLIEHVEKLESATLSASSRAVSVEAEADACACAVANGLVSPLCTRRLDALGDRGLLTLPFCHLVLERIMLHGGGRLDMGAWHEVLRVFVNYDVELDAQAHRLTLHAAVSSRDVVSARLALNNMHSCDAEAGEELEEAVWALQERERMKSESKSMVRGTGHSHAEEEEKLNIADLNGKNDETYLRFCCTAIKFRKPDVACEGWALLLERCGTKMGQELVEILFCTLCDSGFPTEAIIVAHSLQTALSNESSTQGGSAEPLCLSHDALTMSLRAAVTAPRESLSSSRTEAFELRSRIEIVEMTLDLARAAAQCNQVLYTNAVQALEALSGDGFTTPGSAKCAGGLELLTSCHERMKEDGIVPSPEAFEVLITAAGFAMRDPERVRELSAEMQQKIGISPTPTAREALCAALAWDDPDAAAKELESMKTESVIASERCIHSVVNGLVACGQPSEALQLAKSLGCRGEEVKMTLLKGFVACGELESALELFGSFHESPSMPPKFHDLVSALAGGGRELDADPAEQGHVTDPVSTQQRHEAGDTP